MATDIRLGDTILLKDGIATYSSDGVVQIPDSEFEVIMPETFSELADSLIGKTGSRRIVCSRHKSRFLR